MHTHTPAQKDDRDEGTEDGRQKKIDSKRQRANYDGIHHSKGKYDVVGEIGVTTATAGE